MLKLFITNKCRKDLKRAKKRGADNSSQHDVCMLSWG